MDGITTELSEEILINEAIKLLEKNPYVSLDQLQSTVEKSLISVGLRKEIIDQLINIYFKERRLLEVIKFKAILNPNFLHKKTGKKFWFFIVDARYGKYLPLRRITKQWEGDLSRYIIYGPQDTIFRLHGTEVECRTISEALKEANYDFELVEVEEVSYFFKHQPIKLIETKVSESTLRKLVLNYWDKDVSKKIRKDLLDKHLMLGVAVIEKLPITNRIKAFVGVTFVRNVPYEFREKFLEHLLAIDVVKQRLLSVYKCRGASCNYLLEIIVNKPRELDKITDAIPELLEGRLETSTFIVAKATERMPMFIKKDSLNLPDIRYDSYINYIKDVESRFISFLNIDEITKYSKLSPRERHFLISVLDDLTKFELDSLTHEDRKLIVESISEFTKGFVLKESAKLYNAINLSYTAIERNCREMLRRLIDLFYMGNYKIAQTELGMPNKKVNKLTLGECKSSFGRWNESSFSELFNFPEVILTSLSKFIDVRNPISHGQIPVSWREDIVVMSSVVGEAIVNDLSSLLWLREKLKELEKPILPLNDALKLSEKILRTKEHTGRELKEILERTRKTQKISQQTYDLLSFMFADFNKTKASLFGKLDEIGEASQKRNTEKMVEKLITAVEQGNTDKLNGAINVIVKNKEEIIENSNRTPSSRGRVTWLIELSKGIIKKIPVEIAGNIIAQIIFNVGSQYLPTLAEMLHSIL